MSNLTLKTSTHHNKQQAYQTANLRMIRAEYYGPTNTRGSRVKIYEPSRDNRSTNEAKFFSYCYATGDIMEQAYQVLKRNGWNVICRASDKNGYVFLCDNWANEFNTIKDLK